MRISVVSAVLLLSALPALGLEPYLVKDINPLPEPAASAPDFFVNLGSVALFGLVVDDGRRGQELWVTDGTAKNTRALNNLARKEAFFSDTQGYYRYLPRTGFGSRFVFSADDGPHGVEPWVTDGTAKGTRLLKDLCPGPCDGVSYVWDNTTLPGRRFLRGTNGARGQELWVTDGTEARTRLVRDICRGSCDAWPFAPFVVKDRLVFAADDGVHGQEVWSTDGTGAGTVRISDFDPESPWSAFGGWVAGDQLLFSAPGPEGMELWRTDGTAGGTRLVRDIDETDLGGSYPGGLMTLGDEAVFFASDGLSGTSLWKSDGTEPGTLEIRTFSPDEAENPAGIPGSRSAEAAGRLFFLTRSGLWRTDGTEAGTFPLGVRPCCNFVDLRAVGGTVFFQAREGDLPVGLWASDGTVAGTRQVRRGEGGPFEPLGLAAFQGRLFFSAYGPDGQELWRSDGTEAGTVQVEDIHPFSDSNPELLTVHAGRLWFFADDGEHGRELWRSDGTGAGTALAVELEPGPGSLDPVFVVSLGDRLLVFGYSPSQGEGLWESDGMPAGTFRLLPQISRFNSIPDLVRAGSRAFFPAFSREAGVELWAVEESHP